MADYENGINGATGEYLFPLDSPKQIAAQATETLSTIPLTDPHRMELRDRLELRNKPRAAKAGVDPTKLAQAGWGAIFLENYTSFSLEALKSDDGLGVLLKHRQNQATPTYYRECTYKPGWNKAKFLTSHDVASSGAVDPDQGMPYYLLIVGDPATIPYEFQYQLDVQYAVGRIFFDTLAEYAYYAKSVVAAETQQIERPRQIKFWGVSNSGDNATQLSTKHLVTPLSEWVNQKHPTWATTPLLTDTATKTNLHQLINQESAPAILFTASHGVGYPKGDPQQKDLQGALICQEWQPFLGKPDPATHLFSAADLDSSANIHGMIAFQFACYSLGTPQFNNFKNKGGDLELAESPIVARLPQKLLSHEKGGALAVIGHVDRAFSSSFRANNIRQSAVFESVLTCLMQGCPVGYAMEFFNQQYAELASDTTQGIQDGIKDTAVVDLWNTSNNARNYAVLGDPAVRIAIAQPLVESTPASEPIVWFNPSRQATPSQPANISSSPGQTSEPTSSVIDRIEQLEQQVKTLQAEVTSLKQETATLKQRLTIENPQ
jgi:Peptidase family C25